MNKLGIVVVFALLAMACSENSDESIRPSLNSSDKLFVARAATTNATLATFGELALKQSQNIDIHYFAQAMIDHDAQADLIRTVAFYDNVDLSAGMDAKHQAYYNQMKNLSGEAFDSAYIALQIEDHVEAVALFESQIEACKVDNLKNYSLKYLPHIKEHRDRALIIQNRLVNTEEFENNGD